jgi:hypothetical protein
MALENFTTVSCPGCGLRPAVHGSILDFLTDGGSVASRRR